MNERFLRSRFSQLKISEKLTLMEELSVRYGILFKGLYAFSRWGQGIITGVFERTAGSSYSCLAVPSHWAGTASPLE